MKNSPQRNSGIDSSTIEPMSATGSCARAAHVEQQQPAARCRALPAISIAQHRELDRRRQASCATRPRDAAAEMDRGAEVAVHAPGRARSGIAAAAAGRAPSRGAWPRSRRCVAFGGSDIAAGSTGSRRRMQNSSAETMNRMTIETRTRRRDQREDGGHALPSSPLIPAQAGSRACTPDLMVARFRGRRAASALRRCAGSHDQSIVLASTQPLPYFA